MADRVTFWLIGILLAMAVVVVSELTGWWRTAPDAPPCRMVFDGSAYGYCKPI